MPRFDTYIYHMLTGGTIEVYLRKDKYANGRTCLTLIDAEDDITFTHATINIPKEELEPGEVIIKDYGDTQGMYVFLLHHGIISEGKRFTTTPHVQCIICDLLI